MSDETTVAAERYAISVLLPIWMAAATADYFLHRRSRIESTSGIVEARLHLGGIVLMGPPVLAGLLLELDAGVLAFIGCAYVVHRGMTIWDVAYANGRRRVIPLEQHVHGFLEIVPFALLSLLGIAHRAQVLAIVGRGAQAPRWRPRLRLRPVPARAISWLAAAFTVFVAIPYTEEFVRCSRVHGPHHASGPST